MLQNFTIPPKMTVMKKSIFLLMAGVIAVTANGQEALHSSVVMKQELSNRSAASVPFSPGNAGVKPLIPESAAASASRTTISSQRWYNYGVYLSNYLPTTPSYQPGATAPYMWFDTSSQDIYSGTPPLDRNHMVSMAAVWEPWTPEWNYPGWFGGATGMTAIRVTDSYTIDSIEVIGDYGRSAASTSVDTLYVALVYGTGTTGGVVDNTWTASAGSPILGSTSGSFQFFFPKQDSLHNWAAMAVTSVTATTPPPAVVRIPLAAADVNDTDVSGVYRGGSAVWPGWVHKRYHLTDITGAPTTVTIPAGNIVSGSVTYRNWDPNAPSPTTHFLDTVFTGDPAPATYRYNMWRNGMMYYQSAASGTVAWMPYIPGNFNGAAIKYEPANTWGGSYIPAGLFSASSGTAPSDWQYPLIGFHVTCTTCDTVGDPALAVANTALVQDIRIYPNPATDEINVGYALATGSSATITLTNAMGQVISVKNVNTPNGREVFNTTAIPSGVYIITVVSSQGEHTTSKVVISH